MVRVCIKFCRIWCDQLQHLTGPFCLQQRSPGFAQSGPLLGVIVTVLVCLQVYGTSLFILETCRRLEFVRNEELSTLERVSAEHPKFELPYLTRFFLGGRASIFFSVTTCLDLYAISWAFCCVFAQSLADSLPIGTGGQNSTSDYKIYVLVFMVIAVPLSCTSLLDQTILQMTFLGGRLFMVLCMMVTLIHAFVNSSKSLFTNQPTGPTDDPPNLVQWSGLLTVIQLAVFSTAFQFAVPGISNTTSVRKQKNSNTFLISVLFVCVGTSKPHQTLVQHNTSFTKTHLWRDHILRSC